MSDPMPESFGKMLQRYRFAARPWVSQTKLAERAGYDHSYISRIESGTRIPAAEVIRNLSKALDLSDLQRDELLIAAGFLPENIASIFADEPELTDVLRLLRNCAMPEVYRDSIRHVLRQLVDQSRFVIRDTESEAA